MDLWIHWCPRKIEQNLQQEGNSNFPQSSQILSGSKFADFNGRGGEVEGIQITHSLWLGLSNLHICTSALLSAKTRTFWNRFFANQPKKIIHNVCLDYNYCCMKYSLNAIVWPPTWFKCYESINYCLETGYNRYCSRQNVLGVFSILVTNVVFYSVMFFSGIKKLYCGQDEVDALRDYFWPMPTPESHQSWSRGGLAAADFAI